MAMFHYKTANSNPSKWLFVSNGWVYLQKDTILTDDKTREVADHCSHMYYIYKYKYIYIFIISIIIYII